MKQFCLFLSLIFLNQACGTGAGTISQNVEESDGLSLKSWSKVGFLEPKEGQPDVDGSRRSFNTFSLAAYGDVAHLVASFYDGSSGENKGYVRRYQSGLGWAKLGSDFQVVAQSTGDSLGFSAVAANSAGNFFTLFFEDGDADIFTSYRSANWAITETADTTNYAGFSVGTDMSFAPGMKAVYDSAGNGYAAFQGDGDILRLFRWSEGGGPIAALTNISTFAADNAKVALAYDGVSRVCSLYEKGNQIFANCWNTGTSLMEGEVQISGTGPAAGFSLASDGAGGMMAIFFDRAGGADYHVYSSKMSNGTWGTATQIDSAATTGDLPSVGTVTTARPSIAYSGNGSYIAGWPAINTTDKNTVIYYAQYKSGAWLGAEDIGYRTSYAIRPHHRNVVSYANTGGQVGLASTMMTTEATAAVDDIFQIWVARASNVSGWVTDIIGAGCKTGTVNGCTQTPEAVMLNNGNGLVVFPDQDGADRYRVGACEFKK